MISLHNRGIYYPKENLLPKITVQVSLLGVLYGINANNQPHGCFCLTFGLHPRCRMYQSSIQAPSALTNSMHLPAIRDPSAVQDASAFIQAPSALTIVQLQPAIRAPSSVQDVTAFHLGYILTTCQSHRMHLPAIWAPSSLATPVSQDASAQSCHELHPHWGTCKHSVSQGASVLFAGLHPH